MRIPLTVSRVGSSSTFSRVMVDSVRYLYQDSGVAILKRLQKKAKTWCRFVFNSTGQQRINYALQIMLRREHALDNQLAGSLKLRKAVSVSWWKVFWSWQLLQQGEKWQQTQARFAARQHSLQTTVHSDTGRPLLIPSYLSRQAGILTGTMFTFIGGYSYIQGKAEKHQGLRVFVMRHTGTNENKFQYTLQKRKVKRKKALGRNLFLDRWRLVCSVWTSDAKNNEIYSQYQWVY